MEFLGNFSINDTVTFAVNTHDPSDGAAADVDSAGVPAYRVYEDETGTAILTGNMAKLDDANTLGYYSEQLTLSAANGFENGKSYSIYISATVGSVAGTTNRRLTVGVVQRANLVQINGGSTSVGNLEDAFDGTGYDIGGIDVSVLNTAATAVGSDGTGLTEAGGTGDHLTAITNAIDAVDNFVDTEVAAIVSAIGTPSDLGSGATLADNLSDIDAQHASDIIYDGIAVTSSTNNAIFAVATSEGIPSTTAALVNATVECTSGTGADSQPRRVISYTVSAGTATFTVSPAMLTALDGTSVIRIRRGTAVMASSVTGNIGGNVGGNVIGNVSGNIEGDVQGTVTELLASMRSLFRIALRSDAAIATDDALELAFVNNNEGAGAGSYNNTTDSLEASQAEHDATQTAIDAVDNFVDTEIASIISALATAQADLDIITGTAGALIDAGTGAGQLSISSGLLAWNSAWDAEVQSEANDALVAIGLDHLISASVTGTDVADNSIIAKMVSKSATADWDTFDNQSDAMEIRRDEYLSLLTVIDAVDNYIDTEVAALVSAVGTPSNLGSGATLAANTVDIEAQTDDIGAAGAGLSAIPQLSSALTEAYRSDGATGTLAQILYELIAHMGERSISGTTMTLKKLDGSTTAATFTLDDADAPTSITRAS